MAWMTTAVLAVALSAWVHVFTPLSRELLRDVVLTQVNAGIRGRVAVGHIADVDFGRVRVEHLSIFDPEGRRVLYVPEVSVEPQLFALLTGTVHLDSVVASGGSLRLIETPEGPPSIAAAFEPREPAPEETGGLDVVIDEIDLSGFRVGSTYARARPFVLTGVSVTGALSVVDQIFAMEIGSGGLEVHRDGRAVATLTHLEGAWDGEGGGGGEARASMLLGDATVRIDGALALPEEPGGQPQIRATASVRGLGEDDLSPLELGWPPGSFAGELDAELRFEGTPDAFAARLEASTAGGDLLVLADMEDGDRLVVHAQSDGIDLGAVLVGSTAPRVAGTVDAQLTGLAEPTHFDVTAQLHGVEIGDHRIPSARVAAHVTPTHVRIDQVALPYLRGDIDVRGTVSYDGAADLHVEAHVPSLAREPNLQRLLGEVRGALDASLDLSLEPTAGEGAPRIRASGELALRDATIGPARIARLHVAGTAQGRADRPAVDARVTGSDLRFEDVALRSASLHVEGGPDAYAVTGRVLGPEGEDVRLRGEVAAKGDGWEIDALGTGRDVVGRDWGFSAEDVVVRAGGAIEIGRAEVRSGDMVASVSGTYRPSGRSELETTVEQVDVALIAELLGLEDLGGDVDGQLSFGGSVDRPEVEAALVYSGTFRGLSVRDAALVLDLSSREGRLDAQLSVNLSQRGGFGADVKARFRLGRRGTLVDALERADYEIAAEARRLRLALVGDLLPDGPALFGEVSGHVAATGTIARPSVTVALRGTELGMGKPSELDATLEGSYADAQTRVRLAAADGRGSLGIAELAADVDLPALLRRPPGDPVRLLDQHRVELLVQTNARRLDELPAPIGADVPALVALRAHLLKEPGKPTVADADLGVVWAGELRSCGAFARPRARARVRLEDGETRVELEGTLGTEQVLGGTATARTPVDAWLRAGQPPTEVPPVDVELHLRDLALHGIPYLCEHATGTLSGEVQLEQLFGDQPRARVRLAAEQLRYRDMPPSTLALEAELLDRGLRADLVLEGARGDGIDLHAELPVRWRGGVPGMDADEPVRIAVDLDRFHLAPLGALSAVSFAEGTLDGAVRVTGSARRPVFDGRIELGDVAFGLVQPAQRFEEGSGAIVFHRSWIELERIHFHDLGGTLRASGGIGMDGLMPKRVRLALYVDDLPIRQEGVPIGEVTTQADIRAEVGERKIEVWVSTRNLIMEVARTLRTNLQSLEPHPDVVVIGPDGAVQGELEEEAELVPMDITLHVDATDPFWVRREDFAVQLVADLDVQLEGAAVRVGGYVDFRRGYVEILGKRFELEEGRIEFLGGRELDPRLDLLLAHQLAGRPGDQVFVRIVGHLQQPELEFSSTIPGVATAGEVLALLAGGDRGGGAGTESGASSQAAEFLAGVTAGILTLTARRELGDVFPDISLEATGGGARLRAGFDAERLIPGFLEGIVRGAYVEGFVGTGGDDDADAQAARSQGGGGFLIELMFPYAITATAEVQPPAAYSAELMWEP